MSDKPVMHGRDHRPGGEDPITDDNAIRFDTDNEGGSLFVRSNGPISGIDPNYDGKGIALVDGDIDGIVLDSDNDVSVNTVQNGSVTIGQPGNSQEINLNGIVTLDGTFDAGGARITNGADGVDPTDFATVEQVTAGAGVTSLDSIVGAVTLVAGAGIAIADNTPTPGEITISTSGVVGGPFTRGSSTVTFAASSLSGTVTITHGLGATPAAISLQGVDGVSALGLEVIDGSVNSTTFQCRGFDTKGTSRTGTQSFYWVAFA